MHHPEAFLRMSEVKECSENIPWYGLYGGGCVSAILKEWWVGARSGGAVIKSGGDGLTHLGVCLSSCVDV